MSTTKKTTKKTAKKTAKKITLSKEQLTAILKRVESGKSGLIAEAMAAGFNGSKPLNRALTELLGGKVKYDAMLKRAIKARSATKAPAKKTPAKKTPTTKPEPVKEQPVEAAA